MDITYKTNQFVTTASLTEWFFGKEFVDSKTNIVKAAYEKDGTSSMDFWQNGTGRLTVEIH